MKHLIIILTLLTTTLVSAQANLDIQHDQDQKITDKCMVENHLMLLADKGDTILAYFRWDFHTCPTCTWLGTVKDTFGNVYLPDINFGDEGLKCGVEYCEYHWVAASSREGGILFVVFPLYCPVTNFYGIFAASFNNKF